MLWDILVSILWFMLLFSWIWLLVMIVGDLFRDHELSGWARPHGWSSSSSCHGWRVDLHGGPGAVDEQAGARAGSA